MGKKKKEGAPPPELPSDEPSPQPEYTPRVTPQQYADTVKSFNDSIQKASEQYDKAILTVATVGLGFSISVFTKMESLDPPAIVMATLVMIAFFLAIFASLLSFQFTILSVRFGFHLLDRYCRGEDCDPDQRDWRQKSVDWCNWLALVFVVVGVGSLAGFGFVKITGESKMSEVRNEQAQPPKTVPVLEGAGRPYTNVMAVPPDTTAKAGAGRPMAGLTNPAVGTKPAASGPTASQAPATSGGNGNSTAK